MHMIMMMMPAIRDTDVDGFVIRLGQKGLVVRLFGMMWLVGQWFKDLKMFVCLKVCLSHLSAFDVCMYACLFGHFVSDIRCFFLCYGVKRNDDNDDDGV